MMKKFILGFLLGGLLFSHLHADAAATGNLIEVYYNVKDIIVNGTPANTNKKPFIYEDTTYVPIRLIAESLGNVVHWDQVNQQIKIYTINTCKELEEINKSEKKSGIVSIQNIREICIDDKVLILPEDVYIDGFKTSGHPGYIFRRDQSSIVVGNDGMALTPNIHPDDNDKQPFKFLEKYIKGYHETDGH